MKYLFIFVIMCISISQVKADELTTMRIIGNSLLVADWLQTLQIADSPNKYAETNFLLPRNPTRGEVNLYFGTVMASANLIDHYALETQSSKLKLWRFITVLQTYAVLKNKSIGISIKF